MGGVLCLVGGDGRGQQVALVFCGGGMPGIFEPNLLRDDFRVILSQKFFGLWSGVILRSVSPRYARPTDIVSGYGSYRAGGR